MDDGSHSEERLSAKQLKDRYRSARDPVLRAHLHIVWQLSLGKPLREVAELAGYSTKWVKEIYRRYEEQGVEGLGDRRHTNPGAAERALLSERQQRELQSRRSLSLLLKAGCGALLRWLGGSSDVPAGLMCMPSGAGNTSGSWVILRKFRGLPTPRRTKRSRRLSKKVTPAAEGAPRSLPKCAGRAVGSR